MAGTGGASMAGTGGASMAENEGIYDSENGGNKRLKTTGKEEEEDRLSALPDALIQQILFLLPATDLVKTSFLSKWWKNQWTRVPLLKFAPNAGMSSDNFSNFIDKTLILHDSPNIIKFVVNIDFPRDKKFPNLDSWIQFAVEKDVKELILKSNDDIYRYSLPQFVFNNSHLVKLKLSHCNFMSTGKVNWASVKILRLYNCAVDSAAIENVLSASPLLENMELCCLDMFEEVLVIASQSLKTLVLDGISWSCTDIEISCPNLERLRISGLVWFTFLELVNLPSSVYATLDFFFEVEDLEEDISHDDFLSLVKQILQRVEHVEKLEIGRWMMEILSSVLEDGDWIGGLSDSFIHRMISFLPSTKDAFESDLYQTWQRKWTDVAVLEFVSSEKFVIDSKDIPLVYLDPRLMLWIRLAAKKDVKELILDCDGANVESGHEYPLPQFLFNTSLLVKMKICACRFMPNGTVNWQSLKSLQVDHSELGNQAIEHVLSGSPLLEHLEFRNCGFEGGVVVDSEHLKTFILEGFGNNCLLGEISCRNLERLKIWGNLGRTSLKLTNLPFSLEAFLDFYILESDDISPDECMNLVEGLMKQIRHVEELEIELSRMRSSESR